MRHFYLGMAANYSDGEWLRHLFAIGRKRDLSHLTRFLSKRYGGEAVLCKNGRSALALALKANFDKGDGIIINGFTCFAVYEAVKAAGLKPIFADISCDDLNFTTETLKQSLELAQSSNVAAVRGIIVQNTLGNPVDIEAIEKFADEHDLKIIEDLAHCAGVKYPNGKEVGTVGVATACSFGKDKSIDTISGGAVIFRTLKKHEIEAPSKVPKFSDHLKTRLYPMLGAMCRALSYIGLGGAMMRLLVAIHLVEKSADNKLDLTRRPSKFQAKLALKQFEKLRRNGEGRIREFYLVNNRDELLKELQRKGYFFGGFWYEKPVSPERYYEKVKFPEETCLNAVYVAEHIINLPNYYTRRDLEPALKMIKSYQKEGKK
ncbi:DegT/DnrJ/EryC1/StrS aminotransferase family protein [Candidatus Saccharibacteria bacterium]|nr:DegT/DnrJ/EryC1/StrS aminotransferase family protein [Candidatus Saccharibacteria bacterium]